MFSIVAGFVVQTGADAARRTWEGGRWGAEWGGVCNRPDKGEGGGANRGGV